MASTAPDQDFETLLDFLKRNRGFDFTGYKRTTLQRRVQKRMDAVGIDSYALYLDFLEAEADEFKQLELAAYELGFEHVAAGPLVRSSYHADQHVAQAEPGVGPLAGAQT